MILTVLYELFRVLEVVAVTVLYGYLRKQWDAASPLRILDLHVSYTSLLAAALAYRIASREQAYKTRRTTLLLVVLALHFVLMTLGLHPAALVVFIGLALLSVYCNELLPADIVQFRPYEAEIRQFYFEHNPAMLHNVDALLDKHAGRERELYQRIQRKYANAQQDDDSSVDDEPRQPRQQQFQPQPVVDRQLHEADMNEVDRARMEARMQMQRRTEAAIANMQR